MLTFIFLRSLHVLESFKPVFIDPVLSFCARSLFWIPNKYCFVPQLPMFHYLLYPTASLPLIWRFWYLVISIFYIIMINVVFNIVFIHEIRICCLSSLVSVCCILLLFATLCAGHINLVQLLLGSFLFITFQHIFK